MNRLIRALFAVVVLALAACQPSTPAPTLTPTDTPTLTPTPTFPPRPTPVSLITPSATPTITLTPSATVPTLTPTPTLTPSETPTPTPPTPNAEVAEYGEGLRVRSAPGLSAEVVEELKAGTKLVISGRTSDGGWYQVTTPNGQAGWVWGNYLRVLVDANTFPITGEALQAPTVPAVNGTGVISNVGSTSRQIFERGQQLGNRRDVFSKVGDSLTVATFVLYPFGWGTYNLGPYQHLQTAVNFFSTTNAREGNSFANVSLAADNGWTTRDLLDPARARGGVCQAGETPLACEYRVVKPSVALILIGTNDVASVPVNEYAGNLQRIVQITIENGIIPVLSTIPTRFGYDVTPYNQTIIQTAQANGIPLWDYWSAMQLLPNGGLSADGMHPSYPSETDFAAAANFTGDNLQYGYVIRNLTALEALDAVWRYVLSY